MSDTPLSDAYLRPCFICKLHGPCPHREPLVELAYIYARSLPERRPPARENRRVRKDRAKPQLGGM